MTRRRIVSAVALSTALSFASVRALLADNKPNSNGAAQKAAALEPGNNNTLTEKEKTEGWKLLFDGRDLNGWHNFKKTDVRPGWQVKDGVLMCVDPHNAGDIVTEDKFDWFELQLDYNISRGGNSGIIFRVADEGNHVWESGPEFQLEDNKE